MTDPGSSSTLTEPRRAPAHRNHHRPANANANNRGHVFEQRSSTSPNSSRQGSVTSIASSRARMLPSHPSALPHFYESEASASGDEPDESPDYSVEKRKREEARQRRRAKHAVLTSSILDREASPAAPPTKARLPRDLDLDAHAQTGLLEGLGFTMALPETDYQSLVDGASFEPRQARALPPTTYSSSLGSARPSPDQSPSNAQIRARRRSRQLSEASHVTGDQHDTPRITVHDTDSIEGGLDANHVRFDGITPRESERERRSRPRPVSTIVPLELDHIVFPDTLPPEPQSQQSTPQRLLASPTATSFFPRRTAPPSPSRTHNRTPSVTGSHHGIGSYCSSAASIASESSLQLVLDDPIMPSPHFQTPSGRSTRLRGRSVSSNSTDDAPAPLDPASSPPSRSARQARNHGGPTTIVGELLAKQDPSRLYFPSPSPKRPGSTASSERSPPLSIISSVFPSRPRPASHLNGTGSPMTSSTSSSVRLPFPPPPTSSRSTPSLVFPSPPAPASPPRFGRSRYGAHASPSRDDMTHSPSFASTLSSMSAQSVEQPVFPTLGASLSSNGLVRSAVTPRRVSGTPWERNTNTGDDSTARGDELDRMMAAQRTAVSDEESVDVAEAKLREREKERKRRNIYNELMRSNKTSDSALAGDDGELDSFQRELLARDTVKKSLGARLLSDEVRTPSEVSDQEDADSTGITPSTSASSDMSTLPTFPDVPTHTYRIPASASARSAPLTDPDQVEIVLSEPPSVAPSPVTPTFSYTYHPTTPPKTVARHAHRVSLASSTSDQSHYEDAQEEPSRASIDDASRTHEPRLELSKQQTSLWVLDTLASAIADSPGRPLSDIGETEEPEEVLKDVATPASPPTASTSQAAEPVVPPSPSTSSLRGQKPSMATAAVQRCDSPTFSQRSRSTTSSAPVSYTAPKRLPVASAAPLKTKNTFGKKITSLFGGGPSYNAAALGLRGTGISSRDVANLERSRASSDKAQPPRRPSAVAASKSTSSEFSFNNRPSSESHSRSHSHSSSSYSAFPPIPTTPSSFSNAATATFAGPPRSVTTGRATSASSLGHDDNGANKLADLLSKFEQEDKARFKGIAESRLSKNTNVVVA